MTVSDSSTQVELLLEAPPNQAILQFLKENQYSAQSDMIDMLLRSAEGLQETEVFTPDADNQAYYALHTPNGIMFAVTIGLNGLLYKLPNQAISGALVKGGTVFRELQDNWVNFSPYWPEQEGEVNLDNLRHWCRLAYHHALSL